jgi:hypothetical protein
MGIAELARKSKDVIKPFGETEVLLYYGAVATRLKNFLKGKEIAAKNWFPFRPGAPPHVLKRGSKEEPLFIDEFIEAITPEFLELRKLHLDEARPKLTHSQEKVWKYFVPRKLSDFFYATNNEGEGKPLERIFFDLDRGERVSAEYVQEVAKGFVDVINEDYKNLGRLNCSEPFVIWTGASFHVYLFLKKKMPSLFYDENFQVSAKEELQTTAQKWLNNLKKNGMGVIGSHEKVVGLVSIDPSQTPSGKLARSIFSLHMKDLKTVDGVAIPLETKMLGKKNLVSELRDYTPERVIKELDSLTKRII